MSKKPFYMVDETARSRCITYINHLPAGSKVVCDDAPKIDKTRLQEEKYHAMLNDIAKQWKFLGRDWDSEDMKRLCIDQFKRDTIKDPDLCDEWAKVLKMEMAPSLDGSGVVMLGAQSRKFSRKLGSAFVEWLYALGAENNVQWSEPAMRDLT